MATGFGNSPPDHFDVERQAEERIARTGRTPEVPSPFSARLLRKSSTW